MEVFNSHITSIMATNCHVNLESVHIFTFLSQPIVETVRVCFDICVPRVPAPIRYISSFYFTTITKVI